MPNPLLTYRRRIVLATLRRHKAKTASDCLIIKTKNGKIKTVQLTEDLLDGLLARFELKALGEYSATEGIKMMKDIYYCSIDVNGSGEYLTEQGKMIVDELIGELTDFAREMLIAGGNDAE